MCELVGLLEEDFLRFTPNFGRLLTVSRVSCRLISDSGWRLSRRDGQGLLPTPSGGGRPGRSALPKCLRDAAKDLQGRVRRPYKWVNTKPARVGEFAPGLTLRGPSAIGRRRRTSGEASDRQAFPAKLD